MKAVDWQAKDRVDGKIDLVVQYEDGESEHIVVKIPQGEGNNYRDLYLRSVVLSLEHDRADIRAQNALRQQADALRQRIHELTERVEQEKQISPPLLAEFFIAFLAPKNSAQAQLGDLQQMFHANVQRLGERQARRKYWMQVAGSIRPLLWQWLKRVGFLTIVVHFIRSKFGF